MNQDAINILSLRQKRTPSYDRYLVIVLVIISSLCLLNICSVEILDIFKFILTLFFCTLIPGLVLLNALHLYQKQSYRLALALATGICLDIISFIVFSILQIKSFLPLLFLLILIIYGLRYRSARDFKSLLDTIAVIESRYFYSLILLWMAVTALIIMVYFLPNPLPGSGQAIFYYIDYPWHMGNIAEIKNHWYPNDPRLAGMPFHYHVFYYIYAAFIASISGIDIPVLFFRLQTWGLIGILFGAAYYAGSRWFNSRMAGLISVFIFFFGGGLLFSHPFNIFLKNFFFSPTFLLASILGLFWLIEIKYYMYKPGINKLFLILLLTMGVSGAKGSFFPVLGAGLLGTFVYAWFSRRGAKRMTILLISTGLVFSLIFVYIYQGTGSEGIHIVPLDIVRYTGLYEWFIELLNRQDSDWLRLSFFPIYFLAFFSFRVPALFHLIKELAASVQAMDLPGLFLGLLILASFIPGYFLSYRGSSQYYYLFAGFIGLNILAAGYIQNIFRSGHSRIWQALVLILLLLSTGDTILMINQLNAINAKVTAMSNKPLTPGLYAGLSYLRDNTPVDALVGAHRSFQYSPDNPRFFYYSAFAERRMLVEGWQYMSPAYQEIAGQRYEDMKRLYITHNSKLAEIIIRKYDIDYLLVDKHGNQRIRFNTEDLLILKFKNEAVEIYQVIK